MARKIDIVDAIDSTPRSRQTIEQDPAAIKEELDDVLGSKTESAGRTLAEQQALALADDNNFPSAQTSKRQDDPPKKLVALDVTEQIESLHANGMVFQVNSSGNMKACVIYDRNHAIVGRGFGHDDNRALFNAFQQVRPRLNNYCGNTGPVFEVSISPEFIKDNEYPLLDKDNTRLRALEAEIQRICKHVDETRKVVKNHYYDTKKTEFTINEFEDSFKDFIRAIVRDELKRILTERL